MKAPIVGEATRILLILVLSGHAQLIAAFGTFLECGVGRWRTTRWPVGDKQATNDQETIPMSLFSTRQAPRPVSTTGTKHGSFGTKTSLSASTTQYHTTLLDGPCWSSLQKRMASSSPLPSARKGATTPVGYLQIVTGKLESDDSGQMVVGMLRPSADNEEQSETSKSLSTGESLVAHSIATIPKGISSAQAAATYAYAVTHVHSLMTLIDANQVGRQKSDPTNGKEEEAKTEGTGQENSLFSVLPPNHAVVVGGNNEAIWAAQGLQVMGSKVTLVSTQNPKVSTSKSSISSATITVTTPDMLKESASSNANQNVNDDDDDDDLEPQYVGFAEAIGTFDAVLDTLGSEWDSDPSSFLEGSVIRLLRQDHGCDTYMTTYTKAQEMISQEGIFFGPGKVKKYHTKLVQDAPSTALTKSAAITLVPPPREIGSTVQSLLNAGVIWTESDKSSGAKAQVRGWDMKRFMEQTLWPTDSRGSGTVRYGFPVPGAREEEEEDEDNMMITRQFIDEADDDEEEVDEDEDARPIAVTTPYIRSVIGYRGLQQLQKQEITGVLFLSAKWCRTCKRMQPAYRRMARTGGASANKDKESAVEKPDFVFCKGEASGKEGKMLGRALGVETVPTFILFDKGERYGEPLSLSRLPSKKLDLAMEYLLEGKEWDEELFKDDA